MTCVRKFAELCLVASLARAQPVQPRVCANHLSADSPQIRDLRIAIQKMRLLNDKDAEYRSWKYQAAIHGYPGPPVEPPDPVPLQQCQHGNYYFLPWHRMYLHYFERLVRYFSCDDTFRMPYWDWTAGGHVQVPDAFNDSTDDVLYVKGRLPAFDISVQDLKRQFANPFTLSSPPYGFGGGAVDDDSQPGVLFSSGHSEVHCNAGGCLPSPETAARDPLFFLLHSNIDRLWESWLMGKYGHNPRDSDWLNHEFTFANEIGAPERKKVSEFLDIAKLGYSYDRLETPEHVAPKGASIRWITVSALHNRLTPGSETLAADLSVTQEKLLRQALQTPASANLRLEVIDVSWRADPNVRYEACFDPQCKASVGNVSFCIFAAARHHQAVRRVPVEPMYLPIEAVQILAQQLNAQLASNRNAGRIHLWLVPRSIGLANGPVKLTPGSDPAIGSMRLSLAEVQSK